MFLLWSICKEVRVEASLTIAVLLVQVLGVHAERRLGADGGWGKDEDVERVFA